MRKFSTPVPHGSSSITLILTSIFLATGCTHDFDHAFAGSDASVDVASTDDSGGAQGTGGNADDGSVPEEVRCFPPQKKCSVDGRDTCVPIDAPSYGCTADGCTPCPSQQHASIICLNNQCVTEDCAMGWGDCDGNATSGCETNLSSSPLNCGHCSNNCLATVIHVATVTCENGTCSFDHCGDGWEDCDNDPTNGCETNIWDVNSHCGGCTAGPCTVDHGTPSCAGGICHPNGCKTGYDTCGGTDCATNVFEDVNNCGHCGKKCSTQGGTPSCSGGQCDIQCNDPWNNCDGQIDNGCESNTNTDVNHCGNCSPCSGKNVKKRACDQGRCKPTCQAGYGDCNGPQSGNGDDGCETKLNTIENCGECGKTCTTAHGTPKCVSGATSNYCTIASCTASWKDCDGSPNNGCETNIATDTNNCGQCGHSCSSNHGTPSCSGGSCNITCNAGWSNCNNNLADGCETDITTTDNCGTCGHRCNTYEQCIPSESEYKCAQVN